MKKIRQELIRKIIREQEISSQEDLVRLLKKRGHAVSQATVSRDLKELGMARVRWMDGKTVYREVESKETGISSDFELRRIAPEFLLEATSSGNLLVLKTPGGGAQGLAAALDKANIEGIIGTVAGDDTIVAVIAEGINPKRVLNRLLEYAKRK